MLRSMKNLIVILSSESPLGTYQPMITVEYYVVMLDDPRFVRNRCPGPQDIWAS